MTNMILANNMTGIDPQNNHIEVSFSNAYTVVDEVGGCEGGMRRANGGGGLLGGGM